MALPAVRLHPTHRILPQPSKCLEGLGVPRSSLPLKMVWVPNPDRHFPHAVAVVDGDLGLAVLQHDVASIRCHGNHTLVILPMLSSGSAESTTAKLPSKILPF